MSIKSKMPLMWQGHFHSEDTGASGSILSHRKPSPKSVVSSQRCSVAMSINAPTALVQHMTGLFEMEKGSCETAQVSSSFSMWQGAGRVGEVLQLAGNSERHLLHGGGLAEPLVCLLLPSLLLASSHCCRSSSSWAGPWVCVSP